MINEIPNNINLKKIEKKIKFYQTYLFKLVVSSVTIVSLVISGFYYTNKYIVNRSVKEITKTITDSLQWKAIEEVKEINGNTNGRIDNIQSKQNIQEQLNTKILDKIDYNNKVLLIIAGKIDKTLIPLLQDRQSERIKIDSLNNEHQNKYTYNDTLTVENIPHETIKVMYRTDFREIDYIDNLNGINETIKPSKPNNPLKYYIFILN